jgi:hypothetical protein
LTTSVNNNQAVAGISAVLAPCNDLDTAVLDLAAVLSGLVADRFEIIVVSAETPRAVEELRARTPHLPLRVVAGSAIADGCDAAQFELIFVAAGDGQFDVRELNHLFDAVEHGADVAIGYRPRRADGLLRRFQRWGFNVGAGLDCAFSLLRREVWAAVRPTLRQSWCCADLLASVKRHGHEVTEVAVSPRRPTIGLPVSASSRAA